ncbi:MAG: hypothetical protein HYY46_18855 [Deltaproteobacteria bacterium]|nr:hypothetical protein [Deltaproteobacteria bacterium]
MNGMYTGQLGVIHVEKPGIGKVGVTDLERTLIDITVRPVYSGGVFQVLRTFRKLRGSVSVAKIANMLGEIDYVYPYHQAIGFYMEKAGYEKNSLDLLKHFGLKYDFYLTHQMEEPEFSNEWRIFFPHGLK